MHNAEQYSTQTDVTRQKVKIPREVIHTSIQEHNNRPKRLEICTILLLDLIDLWDILHDCVFSPKP